MRRNVIILTSGLTGSSVLTALISRAGYWAGDTTQKKEDYDTYENKELILANVKLFARSDYNGNYTIEFPEEFLARIESLASNIDLTEYKKLIERCNEHRPWIWKDPRLWLTIRFWKQLLDLEECRFVFLTRGCFQSWISATLRRQIRTYRDFTNYEGCVNASVLQFLSSNNLPYLSIQYEELIINPALVINRINQFLETSLTVEDLKSIYHKPLFQNPRPSLLDHIKAMMIYLKNYPRHTNV